MTYVLFMIMSLGGGPVAMHSQEFTTLGRCDSAKRAIVAKNIFSDRKIVAFCTPK